METPTEAAKYALRSLSRRYAQLAEEIEGLNTELERLTKAFAPMLVGVNYSCRLATIIFAGSPLSFFGRSCCRDYVAGLLRCGSWAH